MSSFRYLNTAEQIESDQSIEEFFYANGGEVITTDPTQSGFVSRCRRVSVKYDVGEGYSPYIDVYHMKWMPQSNKAMKSVFEPVASKLLLDSGIHTPEVLAYIPPGVVSDGVSADACVISRFYEPVGQFPIQLESVREGLSVEQQLNITESLVDILAIMHHIPLSVGEVYGLHRCTALEKAVSLVETSWKLGFLDDEERFRVVSAFEFVKNDPLVLVHKDIYTENLLVNKADPCSISAIIDLEHAEFSGIGQDFYALGLFYFPRMGGSNTESYFWDRYAQRMGTSYESIRNQQMSYGMARAAEVFTLGVERNNSVLKDFAFQYKEKYLY